MMTPSLKKKFEFYGGLVFLEAERSFSSTREGVFPKLSATV